MNTQYCSFKNCLLATAVAAMALTALPVFATPNTPHAADTALVASVHHAGKPPLNHHIDKQSALTNSPSHKDSTLKGKPPFQRNFHVEKDNADSQSIMTKEDNHRPISSRPPYKRN